MRSTSSIHAWLTSITLGLAASLLPATALADSSFDVTVAKGQVTVTVHPGWHINKDYSWTIKKKDGDKTIVLKAKADFTLSEKTATVGAVPVGPATLKGAVCKDGACQLVTQDITVQ